MAISRKSKSKPPRDAVDVKTARHAAGLNVGISVLAATALLIVVNVIADRHNYRRDMETLGRYRLSDTAKKILDEIPGPVRLTTIYTSTDPHKKPQDYLPRLRDLLDEMRQRKRNLTVVHITSDRQKAELLERLRTSLKQAAKDHSALINDFRLRSETLASQFKQMAEQWALYPPTGWLAQFGTPKILEEAWNSSAQGLRRLSGKLRTQQEGSLLPDYPDMVRQIKELLQQEQKKLKDVSEGLRALAALPEKVRDARAELTQLTGDVVREAGQTQAALGGGTATAPSNPSEALKRVAASARRMADACIKVASRLDALNNSAKGYLEGAGAWRGPQGSLPRRYRNLATVATSLADQARGIRMTMTVQVQKQVVRQFRQAIPRLVSEAGGARDQMQRLLTELTKVDQQTRRLFEQVRKPDFHASQFKPIRELLDRASKLPELTEQKELIEQIGEDNIVLVEVGGKTGVVPFDDVWPRASRSETDFAEPEQTRRVFYGDMAICSKMLNMVSKPFAEVVITFFEETVPPFMRRFRPSVSGPIPSDRIQTLRERLEKANLKVTDWNLAQDIDPPEPSDSLPRLLLVLQPPASSPTPPAGGQPQPPRWGEQHEEALRKLVDGGTPAVFLTSYVYRPPWSFQTGPSPIAEYLSRDWGLEVKTGWRVLQAAADPTHPAKFKLPVQQWQYMGLSTFTDHPVGRPLKARRLFWLTACPILPVKDGQAGVSIRDILTVPAQRREMWATSDVDGLVNKVRNEEPLSPDPAAGDVLPPFALAVEATKEVGGKQARIIVVSAGQSFRDGYLTEPVIVLKGDGTIASEPPPTGNVDLLVNAAYYLAGKGEYIGAGPAVVQPIRLMTSTQMSVIKALCGLAWPVLMLLVGGAVMLSRRR